MGLFNAEKDQRSSRLKKVAIGAALAAYLAAGVFAEYWLGTLKSTGLGQDFYIYYQAYREAQDGGNPYVPYKIGQSFIYHPSALTFVSPFVVTEKGPLPYIIWSVLSTVAWIAAIIVTLRVSRDDGLNGRTVSLILFLFLGFAPFFENLHVGQIDSFVVLFLCLSLHWAEHRRDTLAGLVLALAILLKLTPLLFLAYFAALRRYRVAVTAILALFLLNVVTVIQFSPRVLVQFWDTLPQLLAEVHPSPYNQSFLSIAFQALRRWELTKLDRAIALAHRVVMAVLLSSALAAGLFLNEEAQDRPLRRALYNLLLAAMVFSSSLVWYHHYLFLLLPLVALILDRTPWHTYVSLGVLALVQMERLFEHAYVFVGLPGLLAQAALLGITTWVFFTRYWAKTATGHRSQFPGLPNRVAPK
jgi:hypothetical protein